MLKQAIPSCFIGSLKVYTPLYLVKALVSLIAKIVSHIQGENSEKDGKQSDILKPLLAKIKTLCINIIRSSLFLSCSIIYLWWMLLLISKYIVSRSRPNYYQVFFLSYSFLSNLFLLFSTFYSFLSWFFVNSLLQSFFTSFNYFFETDVSLHLG